MHTSDADDLEKFIQALDTDVKFERVLHLFYKKYNYKIIFRNSASTMSRYNGYVSGKSYKNDKLDEYSICMMTLGELYTRDGVSEKLTNDYFRIYNASQGVHLFLDDLAETKRIIAHAQKYIPKVYAIADTRIAQISNDDEHAVIKNSLFFNQYRYRIELDGYELTDFLISQNVITKTKANLFSWDPEKNANDKKIKRSFFLEWAKENISDPRTNCRVRTHQNVPTMFFTEHSDVVLFKMQFSDLITKIEHAIILGEKEDESTTSGSTN